jgi:hypothetical protein
MNMNATLYVDQIITSIAKTCQDITSVKNFELLKMIDYTARNHQKIKELVNNGHIEELKELPEISMDVNQGYDLMIFKLTDDKNNRYLAIVYDSADLWQDPEVLEIIPLPLMKE